MPLGRVESYRSSTNDCIFESQTIVELYDLEKDPELDNLAEDQAYSEIVDQLRKRLEAWMISQHDYLPLPSHALQNQKDRRF